MSDYSSAIKQPTASTRAAPAVADDGWFGLMFGIALVFVIVNFEAISHIQFVNPIEKGAILIAAIYFVATRERIPFMIAATAGMISITLVSAFLTRNPDFSWNTYIVSLNQILAPMLLLSAVPTKRDRNAVLKIAAWMPLFSAIISFFYAAAGIRFNFGVEYGTGIVRFQGTLIPAFFAGFAMVGSVAAMHCANLIAPRYLYLAVVNIGLLAYSGARAPSAIAVAICGVIFLAGFKGQRAYKFAVGVAIVVIAVIGLNTIGQNLIGRFMEGSMSGRDLMWAYLGVVIQQFGDFGVGFGHQMLIVPPEVYNYTGSTAAHNDYLRSAVEIGVGQAYVFYGIFILTMLGLWRSRYYKPTIAFLAGIAGYFVLSYTDNTLAAVSHFPLLIVSAYSALKVAPHEC